MNVLEPQIIKDANRDLEDEILGISFSVSFWSWYKVRKILKRSPNKGGEETIQQIDGMLDQIFPTLSISSI